MASWFDPTFALLASLTVCTSAARSARADEPSASETRGHEFTPRGAQLPPFEDDDRPAKPSWYGWQTALSDIVSVGLVATAAASKSDGLLVTGLAGYYLGSPIIHAAHDEGVKFPISLGIRLGAPIACGLLGALAGAATDTPGNRKEEVPGPHFEAGAILGSLVGVTFASVLDSAVFARESAPRSLARDTAMRSVVVAPYATPAASGGMSGGVVGIF